jgi:hypothetical protein
MAVEPGNKIGRYEIRAKIGAGEVYQAQDTSGFDLNCRATIH